MTPILATTISNAFSSFEEDTGEWDTEIVEGATGVSFRNARRAVPIRRFKVGYSALRSDSRISALIALKASAKGRLYGFTLVHPDTSESINVCFADDKWTLKWIGGEAGKRTVTVSFGLDEVLDPGAAP